MMRLSGSQKQPFAGEYEDDSRDRRIDHHLVCRSLNRKKRRKDDYLQHDGRDETLTAVMLLSSATYAFATASNAMSAFKQKLSRSVTMSLALRRSRARSALGWATRPTER